MAGMDLEHSTEPLRQIAVIVTAVLVAVGAALTSLAASVDWTWIAPASTAVTAAIGILTHLFATKRGRAVVWSNPTHQAAVADAVASVSTLGDATGDLDAAARDAGLA